MTDTPDRLAQIKARLAGNFYVSGAAREDIQHLITRLEASEAEVERLCALQQATSRAHNSALDTAHRLRYPPKANDKSATPERCESCGGTGIQRNRLGQASGVGPRCEDCKGGGALDVSRPTAPARGNTEGE